MMVLHCLSSTGTGTYSMGWTDVKPDVVGLLGNGDESRKCMSTERCFRQPGGAYLAVKLTEINLILTQNSIL